MSNTPIDLGTASGFALATAGATNSALTLLGYDPAEWDIQEASYEGVVFHVFTVKKFWEANNWGGALSRVSVPVPLSRRPSHGRPWAHAGNIFTRHPFVRP
jgi:hypothetical protein